MLPKGWTTATLGTCAKFLSGGTPSKANDDYWGGEFPWITVRDMKSLQLESAGLTLTDEGAAVSSIAPKNAVLVVTRGMALMKDLPVGITTRPMAFNQDIKALVANEGIDPQFLAYQLQANKASILDLVDTAGHGTGRLDTDLLKEFAIPVAPEEEQQEIASRIRLWDNAIATTEKLLANSRRQKSALMTAVFDGKQRLGHTPKKSTYRLADLFTERVETSRPDLPLLSVTREDGVIPRAEVGRKDTSNEDKSKYLRVCPGDIAYNTMRMWQGVSAISKFEGIVSPAYTVVVPRRTLIDAQFAAYLFKHRPVIFRFYRYSQGLVSDTWNLKFPHFGEIKVEIPELDEQIAIATMLKDADAQIAALERNLNCLRKEKRALMQDLLTGRRRVRLSASEVAASPP